MLEATEVRKIAQDLITKNTTPILSDINSKIIEAASEGKMHLKYNLGNRSDSERQFIIDFLERRGYLAEWHLRLFAMPKSNRKLYLAISWRR